MRIDFKQLFLTTVALSATVCSGLIGGKLGLGGTINIGIGDSSANASASVGMDASGLGKVAAVLNFSASTDYEMAPNFNLTNLPASTRQDFAKNAMNQTFAAMFLAEMAEIRVFRPSDNSSLSVLHWANHRLLGARELNTSGNSTLAMFDTLGASWSLPMSGEYLGMNCSIRQLNGSFTFVANASMQVPVNVTAYIFYNDYTMAVARGGNVTASFQSVKFTYSIGVWPFAKDSQGLAVLGVVKSTGMGNKASDQNTIIAGDASITIPTAAVADSVDVNVSVNAAFWGFDANDQSAIVVEYDFPVYTSTMVYDPVLGMTTNDTTNGSSSAPSTAASTGGVTRVALSFVSTLLLLAIVVIA